MKTRARSCVACLLIGAAGCARIAGLGDPPSVTDADAGAVDAAAGVDASNGGVDAGVMADARSDVGSDVMADAAAADASEDSTTIDADAGAVTLGGPNCPLAVSNFASCVVRDGGVICWGESGFLGRGNTSTNPAPVLTGAITPLDGVKGIAAGGATTCAFLVDGGVSCWGNAVALADQDASTYSYATAVPAFAGAVEITLASDHGCWRTNATTRYCVGSDTSGRLANGVDDGGPFSTPVASQFPGPYVQTAASYDTFDCAVQVGGLVHCVGKNDYQECDPTTNLTPILDPKRTVGLTHAATAIALGAVSGCAIGDDTRVYCWGSGESSAIGTPSNGFSVIATAGGPLSGVIGLASRNYGYCALTSDGSVECWGENDYGELGRGVRDTTNAGQPLAAPVLDADGGVFGGAIRIASENDHTCVVKSNGEVWCWGRGDAEDNPGDSGDVLNPRLVY